MCVSDLVWILFLYLRKQGKWKYIFVFAYTWQFKKKKMFHLRSRVCVCAYVLAGALTMYIHGMHVCVCALEYVVYVHMCV